PRERRPLAIFASSGDDERRRRAADVFTFGLGSLIVLVSALDREHPTAALQSLTQFLRSLPDWVETFFGGLMALTAVYVLMLFLLAVAAADRRGLVRDLLAGAGLTLVVGVVIARIVEGGWPSFNGAFDGDSPHFPVTRVALVTALVSIASPHLIRTMRNLGYLTVFATVVGALTLEFGDSAEVLGGFGLGLAIAAAIHLMFGSPAGAPSLYHVHEALSAAGIEVGRLRAEHDSGQGPLVLHAEDDEGEIVTVKVHGRDASDHQLLAKTWRFLWYRDSGPLIVSRLQQVEHEAVAAFLVTRSGARTPAIVAMTMTDRGDAVLVLKPPPGLVSLVHWDEAHLVQAWRQLSSLRAAGIAHGSLDGTTLELDAAGNVVVDQLTTAIVSAGEDQLHKDAVALLTLSAISIGPDRAVRIAVDAIGSENLAAAVPYIQPAAMTPWMRRAAKQSKLDFDELRDKIADLLGAEKPDLVQLKRMTAANMITTALAIVAVWFVISKLAHVDFNALVDSLKGATWGWVIVALLVGQLARVAQAVSTMGAATHKLPFGPTVALQFSLTFINVAVPSTAAKVAVDMRYFQKQGAPRSEALTTGVIDSFSGFLGQMIILIICLGFGASSIHFDFSKLDFDLDAGHILLLALVILLIGVTLLTAVKRIRRWTFGFVHQAIDAVRGLRSARRVLLLFGGNMVGEVIFASTLGAAALAVGYHLSLADLLTVNVLVSLFSGLMPLPSIGISEAAITAGLVAVGLPQTDALAAALIYRGCTYYLPPLWGYFALRWLTHHDYL
ncbi:MAG TPA: lysylphosphatidylglycerol synthase transmembrane domain-containing protein, partial [Acidimicrobiales bacterium]